MTDTTSPPVRYEDIDTTPAERLLQLSFSQLNALIRKAERAAHHAHIRVQWLRGLKVEKSLRYGGADD